MNARNDGLHYGDENLIRQHKLEYIRYALGPRVTLALKQAGLLDQVLLDVMPTTPQTGAPCP